MAENPSPSVASVKAELQTSRENEKERVQALSERCDRLKCARKMAIGVVLEHQKMVITLDEELDHVMKEIAKEHVYHQTEREQCLSRFVGSLLREKKGASSLPKERPYVPQHVVPLHTPVRPCFLPIHQKKRGHCKLSIPDCEEFMTLTNPERMKLLFKQHRCFGCFLPVAVAGHLTLAECPQSPVLCDLQQQGSSSVPLRPAKCLPWVTAS